VANTVVTTDFLHAAFDGATTADNNDTSVIASPAAAAAIAAVSVPATFTAADHLGTAGPASPNLVTGNSGGATGLPVASYDESTAMWSSGVPMPELHW
jgi:hypothetical protein